MIPVGGREGSLKGNLGRPVASPFLRKKSSISLPCLSQGVPYFMTMILKKDHTTKVMGNNLKKTLSLNIN